MLRRHALALLPLALLVATAQPTSGQQPGTVELAVFAQRTAFDRLTTLTFGTAPGIGGHAGVYLLPGLSIEAGTSYTWTHPADPPRVRATWVPLRARAVYRLGVTDRFYPMVGFGIVRNGYSDAVDGTDSGLTALAGFKTYVRDRVAFRSDLHLDLVSVPFNEGATVAGSTVARHTNWSFTAGVSIDLGRGRYGDEDRDGVVDPRDACLGTAPGARVDAIGCRLDEDLDGVFDEDDLCPLSPSGVRVDVTGCRVDADRDGVFDEDDLCPATPIGALVDAVGCRPDSDADGVYDESDRCPGTPRGVAVDAFGCVPDTDGDGVRDNVDQCPGTPRGTDVDAVGCPADADRDGVLNGVDLCPDTMPGTEVDATGCRILFEEEVEEVVLEGVTFETSSADLTDRAQLILDGVAAALIANPDIRVRVSGHTDSTGPRDFNIELSGRRAEAVARYLTDAGVESSRLESRGVGPDEPVATNDTPEGRQANRRVALERIEESREE